MGRGESEQGGVGQWSEVPLCQERLEVGRDVGGRVGQVQPTGCGQVSGGIEHIHESEITETNRIKTCQVHRQNKLLK